MSTLKGLGIARLSRMREKYNIGTGAKIGLRGFDVKASDVNAASRIITVPATTDQIDLDEEVVVPSGCDMSIYEKNKRNFVDHRYDVQSHVATMRTCMPWPDKKRFTGWLNRSAVLSGLRNPLADDVLTMAMSEAGIGASIGFEMLDGSPPIDTDPPAYQKARFVVRRCRVIELSFTPMPCNVSCQSLDEAPGKALEQRMAALEDLVVKGRKHGGIALESGIALGLQYRGKAQAPTATPAKKRKRIIIINGE